VFIRFCRSHFNRAALRLADSVLGRCLLAVIISLVLICTSSLTAGQLSSELERQIANATAGEQAKVWIRLQPALGGRQLRQTIQAQSSDRREQHRAALAELRSAHASAQKPLLKRLSQLESEGKTSHLHAYWIVNVVEAEVSLEDLPELAERADVLSIQRVPSIKLIEPTLAQRSTSSLAPDSITTTLSYIKADSAWAAGYTGEGRLVCSFDTGVEGTHDALVDSWKGNNGDSSAAWFDPIYDLPAPHTQGSGYVPQNHGTHVMGIMVGHDAANDYTVGVAPGARWISACVIDVGSTVILRAFEWAADPDGNPNTVRDVPDVINHSWGFDREGSYSWEIDCQNIVFDAIDYTEALGIVNIFAAGNEGNYDDLTIANPANRANDSLDCFAVGNLNSHLFPPVISPSSSQGPSDCNGAVKPNVVAPGVDIHSTFPGNNYELMSGSSMAAPHVSGLVALLRQKNPGATPGEIKEAILTSAHEDLDFPPLPDNTYGWGRIDCMAALAALDGPGGSAKARVYDFDCPLIEPGDTVTGTVVLECLGSDLTGVWGKITGTHSLLTLLQDSVYFGDILTGDTLRSGNSIRAIIDAAALSGQVLSVPFQITGVGLSVMTQLHFVVESPLEPSVVTHNTGRIRFSVSNFGVYGLGPGSSVPGPGDGFVWDDGTNNLWEAGLMIGTGPDQVSSAVHTYIYEPRNDFRVAPGGRMKFLTDGAAGAEQTFCIFNDSNAVDPIGVEVTQETFGRTSGENTDFVTIRYVLRNLNATSIDSLWVGLFLDWDVQPYASNVGGYESDLGFGWIALDTNGTPEQYRGCKLLHGTPATVLTEKGNQLIYIPADGGDGFETDEKFAALTAGFGSADTYRTTPGELFQLTVAGPITLAPGAVDTVSFALLAGNTFADVSYAAVRADSLFTDVPPSDDIVLPGGFALHQNYPNPFNPNTTITFDLPRRSDYRLRIFNILGREVHEMRGEAPAGRVSLVWDASDYASGVYFYRVQAGDYGAVRKMTLLK